ncbi:MAG: transposase [Saprospiraceae bacterium]|nr:transposase [Saprospiraceae bacterium]
MHFNAEYTRNLPHYHRYGHAFFVTFRLYDSLPLVFLEKLSKWHVQKKAQIALIDDFTLKQSEEIALQRSYFREFEKALDQCYFGPTHLKNPEIATIVLNEFHRFDSELYQLCAYTIMPNHVHALLDFSVQISNSPNFDPKEYRNLEYAMNRIKGASSRKANLLLGNTGNPFWQQEYFNRYIRGLRHFNSVVNYIKMNAVSAGFVKNWWDFPYTWIAKDIW